MPLTNKQTYYFQIDALRSAMLLLGVVLHAGLSFMQFPLGDAWLYKHPDSSKLFDVLVLFIHTFRVPVFFVLAGFFIEMNIAQKSRKHILIKKLKRIGIPLVLGVLFLFPLVAFGLKKAQNNNYTILQYISNFDASHYGTIHLWFLYYLLFFYVVHLLISSKLTKFRAIVKRIHKAYLFPILVVFILYTIFILSFINPRSFDGDYAFLPNIGSVLYFLGFYFLGFIFYQINELFSKLKKQFNRYFFIGFFAFGLLLYSRNETLMINTDFNIFENIFFVITAYSFVVGFFGLFLKVFQKQNSMISYISKSAYFVYVVHLPVLTLLLAYCTFLQLNNYLFFIVLIVLTLVVSYGLYEVYNIVKRNKKLRF